MPRIKRPMYSRHHPKGPTTGKDVQIVKWGVHNYETGLLPRPKSGFTPDFGDAMYEALVKVIQPNEGIQATGNIGQATFDVLWTFIPRWKRAEYIAWKLPSIPKPNPVPNVGPLFAGEGSLLDLALTHNTDGPEPLRTWYPAVDTGWIAGRSCIAPEKLRVTQASSANPGDAFYARGVSGLLYWFGHLEIAPAVGRVLERGAYMGRIAWQRAPHLHVGIDARPLIARRLLYGATGNGPDYTFGSPTIRKQLAEALSL